MTLKCILAYLPSTEGADNVLRVARKLAEFHQARLIGIHVIPVILASSVPRYPIPNDFLRAEQEIRKQQAETLTRKFDDETTDISDRTEWILIDTQTGTMAEHVLEHALTADLIVVPHQEDYPLDATADIGSELTLTSGRPVIVVPTAAKIPTVGENVLLAWKPAREATRAFFDSLPIMKHASSTHVVAVDEGGANDRELQAVCSALSDHGVDATYRLLRGKEAGPGLLEEVHNLNCDLLIMGCYGRSRFREMVFGGATRYILRKMDVPVLMSH